MARLKLFGFVKILKQSNLQLTIPKEVADDIGIAAGYRVKLEYDVRGRKLVYTVER